MADVIMQFKMRRLESEGFTWLLKSDVDKLVAHHHEQVIEGNKIREGQRATIERLKAVPGVAANADMAKQICDQATEIKDLKSDIRTADELGYKAGVAAAALCMPCVHHRRLAEKIDVAITAAFIEQNADLTEVVIRVLADEGVANQMALEKQLAALRKHNEELLEKISLDDCACSYDEAGDVCSLHSPVVAALRAQVTEAEKMLVLAIKGRLMTSVSLHPVEIALAALRAEVKASHGR